MNITELQPFCHFYDMYFGPVHYYCLHASPRGAAPPPPPVNDTRRRRRQKLIGAPPPPNLHPVRRRRPENIGVGL